jgi:hypothetical protein
MGKKKMKVVQDEMLQRGLGGYAPQVAAALLLLYYCFTAALLLLLCYCGYAPAGHRETGCGRFVTLLTAALLLLYHCCTNALLRRRTSRTRCGRS